MLRNEGLWAREWLFDHALPLWWEIGADPAGGFHEKIELDGTPVPLPRRLRVQARQAYTYIEAGRLGWQGPWREAARHAMAFLGNFLREDGLARMLVAPDGRPLDDSIDLYDQAFVLLACAKAHAAGLEGGDWLGVARRNIARIRTAYQHPAMGFEEANPPRLPLRSNPHMHLLEASLAWVEAGVRDPFEAVAREIVTLATTHLIDKETGGIGEYYDGDWHFAAAPTGGAREPGHQFEWAYLLDLAGRMLDLDLAAPRAGLYAFGARHGISQPRGVAVYELDAAGAVTDPRARLWAQTERLRTALVLKQSEPCEAARADLDAAALAAAQVVKRYLDVPVTGLWRDQWLADGTFVEEPAPASSFYHVISAYACLLEATGS